MYYYFVHLLLLLVTKLLVSSYRVVASEPLLDNLEEMFLSTTSTVVLSEHSNIHPHTGVLPVENGLII